MLMHKIRIECEHEQQRERFAMDLWGNWMALYVNGFKKDHEDHATIETFYPRERVEETKISEADLAEKAKAIAQARTKKQNG